MTLPIWFAAVLAAAIIGALALSAWVTLNQETQVVYAPTPAAQELTACERLFEQLTAAQTELAVRTIRVELNQRGC